MQPSIITFMSDCVNFSKSRPNLSAFPTRSSLFSGPVHLNSMQKRQVKKQIDQHAEPTIKRLKLISEKRKMDNLINVGHFCDATTLHIALSQEWNPHVINEYIKCDPSCSTDNDDDADLVDLTKYFRIIFEFFRTFSSRSQPA